MQYLELQFIFEGIKCHLHTSILLSHATSDQSSIFHNLGLASQSTWVLNRGKSSTFLMRRKPWVGNTVGITFSLCFTFLSCFSTYSHYEMAVENIFILLYWILQCYFFKGNNSTSKNRLSRFSYLSYHMEKNPACCVKSQCMFLQK